MGVRTAGGRRHQCDAGSLHENLIFTQPSQEQEQQEQQQQS